MVSVTASVVAGCSTTANVTARTDSVQVGQARTGQPGAAAPFGRDHIVAVYRSHCGVCHRPVPPGSEPPDKLDAALSRHHKRAHLTDQEWDGLGRFMAGR